jgi:hypothetical protein
MGRSPMDDRPNRIRGPKARSIPSGHERAAHQRPSIGPAGASLRIISRYLHFLEPRTSHLAPRTSHLAPSTLFLCPSGPKTSAGSPVLYAANPWRRTPTPCAAPDAAGAIPWSTVSPCCWPTARPESDRTGSTCRLIGLAPPARNFRRRTYVSLRDPKVTWRGVMGMWKII